MKILYVNPNINHHRLPFFQELQKIYGIDNVIYATPVLKEEWRTKMGFHSVSLHNSLLHINTETFHEFKDLFENSDVVLCCVRDYWKLMEQRLIRGKLTFYFSERWFKEPIGKLRLLYPPILNKVRIFKRLFAYDQFFFLAQGITAAEDFFSLGIANNKTFSFGYFPPMTDQLESESKIKLPSGKINILWCGRMMKLKNVDLLAKAFVVLSRKYNNIYLSIIGNGSQHHKVEKILSHGCAIDNYSMYDFLPNYEIRAIMRQADIYAFPSSGGEGWGAVINEAMAESCAIVAGDRIGSVKSIFNEKVGIKFKSGSLTSLISALDSLISNPMLIQSQKEECNQYIRSVWSPEEAASRFCNIVSAIFNKKDLKIYSEGPMSLIH